MIQKHLLNWYSLKEKQNHNNRISIKARKQKKYMTALLFSKLDGRLDQLYFLHKQWGNVELVNT